MKSMHFFPLGGKIPQMNLEIFAHRNIVAEEGDRCGRNFIWNGSERSIQLGQICVSLMSVCLAADEDLHSVNGYIFVKNKILWLRSPYRFLQCLRWSSSSVPWVLLIGSVTTLFHITYAGYQDWLLYYNCFYMTYRLFTPKHNI